MKHIDFTIDSSGAVKYETSGLVVQGENNVTRLTVAFPLEYEQFSKYIVFHTKRGIYTEEGMVKNIEIRLSGSYFDLPLGFINAGIEEIAFRAVNDAGTVFATVKTAFPPVNETLLPDSSAAAEVILTGTHFEAGDNIEITKKQVDFSNIIKIDLKRPLQNPIELGEINGLENAVLDGAENKINTLLFQPNGLAGLDENAKVPKENISLDAHDIGAVTQNDINDQKGAENGLAPLENSKIPNTYLPDISNVVASHTTTKHLVGQPVLTDLVNGVFTLDNHGLRDGVINEDGSTDYIIFMNGVLPNLITAGTVYVVMDCTQNTFRVQDWNTGITLVGFSTAGVGFNIYNHEYEVVFDNLNMDTNSKYTIVFCGRPMSYVVINVNDENELFFMAPFAAGVSIYDMYYCSLEMLFNPIPKKWWYKRYEYDYESGSEAYQTTAIQREFVSVEDINKISFLSLFYFQENVKMYIIKG